MEKKSKKRELIFLRPLLDYYKDEIYKFSNRYKIPYFKDTTPKWSKRGLLRNELFPNIEKVYGDSWRRNLNKIGYESRELKEENRKKLVSLENKLIKKKNRVYINREDLNNLLGEYNRKMLLKNMIRHIFHSILGLSSPKDSLIESIDLEKKIYLEFVVSKEKENIKSMIILTENIFMIINEKLIQEINNANPKITEIEESDYNLNKIKIDDILEGKIRYMINKDTNLIKTKMTKHIQNITKIRMEIVIKLREKLLILLPKEDNDEIKKKYMVEYNY